MTNFIVDNSSDFAEQAKQKIAEFNAQHWDASKRQALGLKQVNAKGEVVAMLAGRTFGNWFYLESFWLQESERGKGLGSAMLAEAEAIKAENRRLKALLGLGDKAVKPVAVARLVGSTATSGRRFAYLGAGRTEGVAAGMSVLSERGVIGRVLETGRNSARVLLLTDSESVLPVRRAKGDVVAFAEGRGDGMLRVRLVNLGINPLKVGDLMVTSGAGGYYRPGVAVAIIAKITPDGGIARLVAEPSATGFVAVEPIYQPEAVSALAEPRAPLDPAPAADVPATTPTASPSNEGRE